MKHISEETYNHIIEFAAELWKHNNGWNDGVWIEHDKFLEAYDILNVVLKENDNKAKLAKRMREKNYINFKNRK